MQFLAYLQVLLEPHYCGRLKSSNSELAALDRWAKIKLTSLRTGESVTYYCSPERPFGAIHRTHYEGKGFATQPPIAQIQSCTSSVTIHVYPFRRFWAVFVPCTCCALRRWRRVLTFPSILLPTSSVPIAFDRTSHSMGIFVHAAYKAAYWSVIWMTHPLA